MLKRGIYKHFLSAGFVDILGKDILLCFEELIQNIIIISVLQSLDGPNANTFMNLLEENGNAEKAMEFARKKIPDFEAKVREKICYELKHIYY